MMIIGRETFHANPTVHVPPWDDHPTDVIHSPVFFFDESEMAEYDAVSELDDYLPLDAFASDHFRMYEFKIRRCSRARSHDWTECPYAHPGEKARRRDLRQFHYSGNPCPEYRKGNCTKGETCEFAHGVFECWLHPSRYRTQPCKDGVLCRRRICFFAHTPEQLRIVPTSRNELTQSTQSERLDSYDGSPSRLSFDSFIGKSSFGSSPSSPLSPISPVSSTGQTSVKELGQSSVNEVTCSIRNMQIGNGNGVRLGFCSPRNLSTLRPGSGTRIPTRNVFDLWEEEAVNIKEEPVMERVESGKEIRARMYAKLSRENSLVGRVDPGEDFGWVSELVK